MQCVCVFGAFGFFFGVIIFFCGEILFFKVLREKKKFLKRKEKKKEIRNQIRSFLPTTGLAWCPMYVYKSAKKFFGTLMALPFGWNMSYFCQRFGKLVIHEATNLLDYRL